MKCIRLAWFPTSYHGAFQNSIGTEYNSPNSILLNMHKILSTKMQEGFRFQSRRQCRNNSIRQFLAMKDTVRMPEEKQIRYMSIDDKEYQNREYALGTVENILKGEPEPAIKRDNKEMKNNRQKAAGRNNFKKRQDGTIDYPQPKTTPQGREVKGEVIRYDNRKQQLLVRVEGKEIAIGMSPLQAFHKYTEGQNILLLKNGKDCSVKEPR